MTTHTIRISTTYGDDHQECSALPGIEVRRTKHGITLELTIGQLVELASRADHYADRDFLSEHGMYDLYRSAVKVCDQLKVAGLWDLARSKEARVAYNEEWDAAHAAA
jgi:hypothetical protein